MLLYTERDKYLTNLLFVKGEINLINTDYLIDYKKYNLDAISNYAGLKKQLPQNRGSNNIIALVLLYNRENNKYYSYVREDSKQSCVVLHGQQALQHGII